MDYYYEGSDLGAIYNKEYTSFKVWSPVAENMMLVLYESYHDISGKEYNMKKRENGIWEIKLYGDYKNKYYNYKITIDNVQKLVVDPYTKGATANGRKGMILDFSSTNPNGWDTHKLPKPIKQSQAIIYEVHIRDFTVDKNIPIKNRGKYLAFTESAVLEYLQDLGITHLHILPIFDFESIDETIEGQYNWGYDPCLYNVPEGSYATDPYDGCVRIKELKQMIKSLHEKDIRVVMDVVYNHTYKTETSPFDILVPKYYYRLNKDGSYSNGSGCGNEVATEKKMVRKFIIDSLKFWVSEYKIDGFRFDLMGLIDIETMKEIEKELRQINPNVLIYGEPWTAGESTLDYNKRFLKGKQKGTKIAVFNDDFRDAIKGDNDGYIKGFINGGFGFEKQIKKGISGSIFYDKEIYGFCNDPVESINYVSSHDNLTLFDKIKLTSDGMNEEEIEKMNRLALSIILTSQGVPFIHSGSEILRSKKGHHNTYNLGDDVNKINWENKYKYHNTLEYIKNLIHFRKSQKVMMLENANQVREALKFIDSPANTVVYTLTSKYNGDYKYIFIVHNANKERVSIKLPKKGEWFIIADEKNVYINKPPCKILDSIQVPSISTYILCKKVFC
ncbi:pullulanase [Alkalithermobacter thermoalcaliphilus JW-YL-7 = DSM 7308]|uniref:Pullulanase n=1 Tax=Alkalithermobacter thermoalcaliphilus JW-YL-7 = DSM 7308 TaxID=1121328 RepID=A0A150FQ71_CLOPD|nr:pullulanase, type I [[Clostridium] paradoxum JW-YL-7 = DSM 7308]SHK62060.1 pullulanase [[Clostridium] paradoxum JW-YL-7 = DSM 7308]